MSLYSNYLTETGQRNIIETNEGFATYEVLGTECYIVDIYVLPDLRKSGKAAEMADKVAEIAKSKGCRILTGSVNTKIKDPTSSIKVLIAYGMKFIRSTEHILFFGKELQ